MFSYAFFYSNWNQRNENNFLKIEHKIRVKEVKQIAIFSTHCNLNGLSPVTAKPINWNTYMPMFYFFVQNVKKEHIFNAFKLKYAIKYSIVFCIVCDDFGSDANLVQNSFEKKMWNGLTIACWYTHIFIDHFRNVEKNKSDWI